MIFLLFLASVVTLEVIVQYDEMKNRRAKRPTASVAGPPLRQETAPTPETNVQDVLSLLNALHQHPQSETSGMLEEKAPAGQVVQRDC
jgi:hypothetical protein